MPVHTTINKADVVNISLQVWWNTYLLPSSLCRLTSRMCVSQRNTNVNKTAPIQLNVAAPFLVATGTHYTLH